MNTLFAVDAYRHHAYRNGRLVAYAVRDAYGWVVMHRRNRRLVVLARCPREQDARLLLEGCGPP